MDESMVSFRVAKDDFSKAVAWVARSLPAKPTLPVLRGVLIEADDAGLTISGYDFEVSTQVKIPAEVITPGRFAVAGKLIADITATLPDQEIELQLEGSKLLIQCGKSRFELPLIPLDDYPVLPALPPDIGTVNPSLFAQAVSQVAVAAGRDETIPMLTGILVEIDGNEILLAATDRFRMAVRSFTWNCPTEGFATSMVVPAKVLLENAKSLDAVIDEDLHLAANTADGGAAQLLGIRADNRKTTTRLLDGKFPNFKPLLPKVHQAIASVDIHMLQDAIKRVSLVADRNAQIRLEFSENQVIISSGGSEAGHAEETIPCAYTGPEMITAFNPSYLREGLSVIRTERVVFGFTQPSRPAVLIPEPKVMPEANEDGEFPTPETDFTYVLMPVRVPS